MARPRSKSAILIFDNHAEIVCTNCNFIIDLEDVEKVSRYRWFSKLSKSGSYYGYAHYEGSTKLSLHRFVMNVYGPVLVDHTNRNTLDTRKGNLRTCTRAENNRNAKKNSRGVSKYKGVTIRPSGRFGVYIQQNGKPTCLGTYDSEEEAALKYNDKAVEIFGEFANLNIVTGGSK